MLVKSLRKSTKIQNNNPFKQLLNFEIFNWDDFWTLFDSQTTLTNWTLYM